MAVRIIVGDCRTVLAELPDASVHCCVTSPPYLGLRDYQVAGQIGLEPTPDEYVAEMVNLFREVRRVLREDATCWVNLGDSYAANAGGRPGDSIGLDGYERKGRVHRQRSAIRTDAIKPKDLMMMPARVAIALQADGWWLRKDIIWVKSNPMPEAATDRPTSAHEHIFLLTKSARYFYDGEAIREGVTGNAHSRGAGRSPKASINATGSKQNESFHAATSARLMTSRNCRDVWTIAGSPFRGAHFATFPPKLPELCIKAGTSEQGCCRACGAPLVRVVEKGEPNLDAQRAAGGDRNGAYHGTSTKSHDAAGVQNASDVKRRVLAGMVHRRTAGWRPSCECIAAGDPVPCMVLDPFGGAGTTGMVADRLGRDSILIELNPDTAAMARVRIVDDGPMFAEMTT